jgi:hypothetical protein
MAAEFGDESLMGAVLQITPMPKTATESAKQDPKPAESADVLQRAQHVGSNVDRSECSAKGNLGRGF